ncbi:hypothetical protein DFQ30_002343 [Apophysomyces sp. BC1015]|nr:hypothetical protein DFQ30_002343 [Apophysomyces sp. BC1015]KAG0179936.1 hypothetical protein DFQ29_001480 [Apophysomyces sp. BC1021]
MSSLDDICSRYQSHAEEKDDSQYFTEHNHLQDHLGTTVADISIPEDTWKDLPVKGAFVMILRSADLANARSAIRSIEDRFNHRARYPWVLIHFQSFTPEFRKYVSKVTSAPTFIGRADPEAWGYPSWINVDRVEKTTIQKKEDNIPGGGSISYHQKLR